MSESGPLIVIDARVVVSNQSHGIARHTDELLRQIFRLPTSGLTFVVLVSPRSPYLKIDLPKNFAVEVMRTSWISLFGQLELAMVLRRLNPALYHSPSFIVPLFSRVSFVATIHDLIHVVMSKDYTIFHRLYYGFFLARKLKAAKAVITVSDFSRYEIMHYFGIESQRVHVIYNGISQKFSRQRGYDEAEKAAFRDRFEIPDNFILSVGNKKAHKNIVRLVEAWCRFGFTENLVLLTEFDPKLLDIASQYNKRHKLYFVRFISDDHLPLLYSMARVFVYPSLYEGFGLPPLEAAACGVPVVVSNRSSLPEVMEDCAIYVEPEDVASIAEGVRQALQARTPEVCENVARGKLLVAKYSWETMARETLTLYRSLLGLGGANG